MTFDPVNLTAVNVYRIVAAFGTLHGTAYLAASLRPGPTAPPPLTSVRLEAMHRCSPRLALRPLRPGLTPELVDLKGTTP